MGISIYTRGRGINMYKETRILVAATERLRVTQVTELFTLFEGVKLTFLKENNFPLWEEVYKSVEMTDEKSIRDLAQKFIEYAQVYDVCILPIGSCPFMWALSELSVNSGKIKSILFPYKKGEENTFVKFEYKKGV